MKEILTAYGLQFVVDLIAVFALWKDWNDYRRRSQEWGKPAQAILALAAFLFIVLSLADTHYSRKGAAAQQSFLSQQVDELRADSKVANDGFRQSFAGLYDKFSQLQAKVQTDVLLKQNTSLLKDIDETKKELVATQTKLAQPKAAPVASFQTEKIAEIPITELTVDRTDPVSVSFIVYNPSDTNALNGAVNIEICQLCSFEKEPVGFKKIAGEPENQRSLEFQHIFAKSAMQLLTLDIRVPSNVGRMEMGVRVVCDNCAAPSYQSLFITLR